ncbi:MAG: hypothetical protein JKY66_07420 [Spongiibacteraceae bacterium]|nr:hypothetical protein [Spongiibacteraceae bacterium]
MLSRLLDNPLWLKNEQAPRYFTTAFAATLVAALSIVLVQFYQTYFYQVPTNTTPTRIANNTDSYKAQTITSRHLFGQLTAVNEQQLDRLNLPHTQLQLILRGAFTSSDPTRASAIIEIPDKKTLSFKIKSTVYGNALLHAVYRDRVVLSRSGQLETLYFPEPQQADTSGSRQLSTPGVPSDIIDLVKEHATLNDVKEVSTQLSSPTITAEQRRQLIRQRLQELRNRAKK